MSGITRPWRKENEQRGDRNQNQEGERELGMTGFKVEQNDGYFPHQPLTPQQHTGQTDTNTAPYPVSSDDTYPVRINPYNRPTDYQKTQHNYNEQKSKALPKAPETKEIYPSGSLYDRTVDYGDSSSLDDFEFGGNPIPPPKGGRFDDVNARPHTPLLEPFKKLYEVEVKQDPRDLAPDPFAERVDAWHSTQNPYKMTSIPTTKDTGYRDYSAGHGNYDEYYNTKPSGSNNIKNEKFTPTSTDSTSQNMGINPFDKDEISLPKRSRYHYTQLPYFTLFITLIQIIVFIVELVKMSQLTGSAFQTKPYFNPMLGPLTYLLINMGARYVPCMRQVMDLTDDTLILYPCANLTTLASDVCSLNQLCGLSGLPVVGNSYIPAQWYRIITPMFLHAGFLHIIFNILLQLTMGTTMEKSIGFVKFAIIYLASGIGGFILGANFTPSGIASTGASGALFGVVATNIISFIYCGRKNRNIYGTRHYALFICIMVGEIVVSLVLGLLPGLDNFSHVGGFAIGILTAILFLPDPFFIYEGGLITLPPKNMTGWEKFKSHWDPRPNHPDKILSRFYIWCGVRFAALVLTIAYFVALIKNFFVDTPSPTDHCTWCKYLNCIPVKGWCDIGQVTILTETDSSTPTPTPTPTSSSSASSVASVTSASKSSLPSSIENFGGLRRQLGGTDSILESQNIGAGFYVVIAFMTLCFMKRNARRE